MPNRDHVFEGVKYLIREAQSADAKAFRMLLPAVGNVKLRMVAVSTADNLVVGAAAVSQSMRSKPPIGPGVAIHVIPPCRRKGIGGAMLRSLHQAAEGANAEAMYAMRKVEAATDEEQGWRWLGFQPLETVVYHELPLEAIELRLAPLQDWLNAKQAIPENAKIIALCDADREAVADLHVATLGGDRNSLLKRMRGEGLGAYHPLYSRVLVVDGKTKGCILAHRESEELAVVDANVLATDLRGGWANLWLKLEATRGAANLGIDRFVYSTFDHYEDTRAFSQMLGGVETKRMLLMHRLINEPFDESE